MGDLSEGFYWHSIIDWIRKGQNTIKKVGLVGKLQFFSEGLFMLEIT